MEEKKKITLHPRRLARKRDACPCSEPGLAGEGRDCVNARLYAQFAEIGVARNLKRLAHRYVVAMPVAGGAADAQGADLEDAVAVNEEIRRQALAERREGYGGLEGAARRI